MIARIGHGLPLWSAAIVAVIGGIVNALAYPGLGWWPLIFVGTPLVFFALVDRRAWGSALVGMLAGLAFWGTHIFWLTVYLGPVPWAALAGLESVFYALGCVLIALAWRWGDQRWGDQRRGDQRRDDQRREDRLPSGGILVPFVVAGVWTLREAVSTTWPYGGFSWGRLAFSQSESVFRDLVAWVGVAGLSFLIAWVSALVVVAARRPRGPRRVIRSLAPIGLLIAMLLVPSFPVQQSGTVRIAAVQGDADAGLLAEYTPGEILADHVAATRPLYGRDVDLVVWPENSSDLNPLEYPESARTLDTVAERMSAPLITGTITSDDDDRVFNSILLWEAGEGATAQYDKIHPVPFAEYLPDREFWYPLAPPLFDLIPRDYSIGQRPNVFDIDVGGELGGELGRVQAGIAICFDIVDDALIRQMIDGGAEIILGPTNNADFGRTDESVQQLAIARLRAIETGRSVVNASTVGTSAIITPDGTSLDQLPTFEPGSMVEDVPLSTTTTLATAAGRAIEIVLSAVGLLGVIALGLLARRSSRHRG